MVVLDPVGAVAAIVFVGIIDSGDEDEDKREDGGTAAKNSELGELVEDDDD